MGNFIIQIDVDATINYKNKFAFSIYCTKWKWGLEVGCWISSLRKNFHVSQNRMSVSINDEFLSKNTSSVDR